MKIILAAALLAGGIALGAVDIVFLSGQPSTPAASTGAEDTTLAAQTLVTGHQTSNGCWVPGDLIGDANPATIRCFGSDF
jgi:hypothetical protein